MAGIFKAYDIRGRYPQDINEDNAYLIGRAFVTFTGTTDIMLGRDARTHSPALARAFIKGALEQGADVTEIGQITTSQMIALRSWHNHNTAVMVTASHLDAPFNGFKMLTGIGQYVSENYGMRDVERIVSERAFPKPARTGHHKHANYIDSYVERILAVAGSPTRSEVTFVADASCGTIGAELHGFKAACLPNLIIINDTPDGTFPAHSPNPIAPGAADQAGRVIRETNAVGGCVFDADADRVTFLDEKGNPIMPNYISCLLVKAQLENSPGASIAYDLISTRALPETITECGGIPIRSKVGRASIIAQMMSNGAAFGAETSSHMMFKETFYGEAVGLALLRVLELLAREGKPLSELVKPYERYVLLPETNYRIERAKEAMEQLEAAFPDAQIDYLDGVSLSWTDSWIVARMSNTEPLLRIRAEADTQEILDVRMETVSKIVHDLGGALDGGHGH